MSPSGSVLRWDNWGRKCFLFPSDACRVGNPWICKTSVRCRLPTLSGVCQLLTTATSREDAGGLGPSLSELLEPLPSPHLREVSAVKSCQTPGRVGSLQCTRGFRDHGLPTLQASEGNTCNCWRPQLLSHIKMLSWGPSIYP